MWKGPPALCASPAGVGVPSLLRELRPTCCRAWQERKRHRCAFSTYGGENWKQEAASREDWSRAGQLGLHSSQSQLFSQIQLLPLLKTTTNTNKAEGEVRRRGGWPRASLASLVLPPVAAPAASHPATERGSPTSQQTIPSPPPSREVGTGP